MSDVRRIQVLVTNDLSSDRRMHRICDSLARAGYRVKLTGRGLPLSPPLFTAAFSQDRHYCIFNSGALFYLEINIRFVLSLLFTRLDILYCSDTDTLPAGIFLSWFKNVKLVYDAHEWFSEVPELAGRKIRKSIWKRVTAAGVSRSDLCITVNGALARELEREYGRPFAVVRNVPVLIESREANRREGIVLYQGALNKDRGLEELLMAAVEMEEVVIWIAGEGDLSAKLRRMADTLGIAHKVRFWGRLDDGRLREIGRQAWLGYNLLREGSKSYYYSLSNKFFDYMHAGIPSINPPFPAYKEILDRHPVGTVVPQAVPSAIAGQVSRISRDPSFYKRMAEACKEARKEYNWQKEEDVLLNIISGMLQPT